MLASRVSVQVYFAQNNSNSTQKHWLRIQENLNPPHHIYELSWCPFVLHLTPVAKFTLTFGYCLCTAYVFLTRETKEW